jgi:uncharacterized protein YjlB
VISFDSQLTHSNQGSPRWTSQTCDKPEIMAELVDEISRVPLPAADPVEGELGTLIRLWMDLPGKRTGETQ